MSLTRALLVLALTAAAPLALALPASAPAAAQGTEPGADAPARPARPARSAPRAARPAAKPDAKPDAKPAAEAPAEEAPAAQGRRGRRGRGAKPDPKSAAPAAPASLQANLVGTYTDWSVFAAGQGRARICYAISQPKTRSPKTLKRDDAYLFVSVRKAENVSSELALMMGFAVKQGGAQAAAGGAAPARSAGDPTLAIGPANYALVVKETNAWLQNPAEEGRVVGEMGRAQKLVVRATSLRGNGSTDEYSLAGFNDAFKRTREECK